ncbi:hypothetical protein PO909_004424 [Leuciscus waleckii]
MGCKLPKPRGSDEAPGKILSTLRRAQVETHSGVAYTYHFLDFLLGKEGTHAHFLQLQTLSLFHNLHTICPK